MSHPGTVIVDGVAYIAMTGAQIAQAASDSQQETDNAARIEYLESLLRRIGEALRESPVELPFGLEDELENL